MPNLTDFEKVKCLLEYLTVLCNGKIRPNRDPKGLSVRDSKDNLNDIVLVKKEINKMLDLHDDNTNSSNFQIQ